MNSLSFCSSLSTALINSQSSFEECQICNPTIISPKIAANIEEKSKFSNQHFKFNELTEVIKYLVGSYLDFLDLTRLATTQSSYRHILKYQNKKYSPYIIQKLRCAKVLTPEILYLYKQASGKLKISSFFKECHVLSHVVINFKPFELGERIQTEFTVGGQSILYYEPRKYISIAGKKLFFNDKDALIKNLNSNIKHLTMIFDWISFDELSDVVKACPNIEHLSLSGNMYCQKKLKTILDQFNHLKFLALTPRNRNGVILNDNLSRKDISDLIARGIHIKLLKNGFEA